MEKERIIYSLSVEDIFNVAEDALERKPTREEINFVEEKIGEGISWYDTIENLLLDYKKVSKQNIKN